MGCGQPPCGLGINYPNSIREQLGNHTFYLVVILKSVQPFSSKGVTCSFCQMAEFFGPKQKRVGAGPQGT